MARAFPVIDKFLNGAATSVKSIDLTAKTCQDTEKLASTLGNYVDKVANFKGAAFDGVEIKASQITARELQIAVPKGSMTTAQRDILNATAVSAQKKGVKLTSPKSNEFAKRRAR